MRTLYLLRHGKSSWDDPTLADHERPLASRGRRAATMLAEHLGANRVRPALVLCSSAVRTRETLDLVLPALGPDVEVRVEDELYGAEAEELLDRLHRIDGEIDSVMIVGHNPGLQDLALALAVDGEPSAIAQLDEKFPTGALATLAVGGTRWDELGPGDAHLASVVIPRHLRP